MVIHSFRTGGDRNLGYLVADDATKTAVAIDPSYDPAAIVRTIRDNAYALAYVFSTHNHHDHTNGNLEIERLTGVRALLLGDVERSTGVRIKDDAVLPLGKLAIRIFHTPGHTPDSICLHIGDALFTGDTLFVGKVGGTDFDCGARTEFASLHRLLDELPDETRIFPGHDVGVAVSSTIGEERQANPFLLQSDVLGFIALKRNWAAYKKEHGIA